MLRCCRGHLGHHRGDVGRTERTYQTERPGRASDGIAPGQTGDRAVNRAEPERMAAGIDEHRQTVPSRGSGQPTSTPPITEPQVRRVPVVAVGDQGLPWREVAIYVTQGVGRGDTP